MILRERDRSRELKRNDPRMDHGWKRSTPTGTTCRLEARREFRALAEKTSTRNPDQTAPIQELEPGDLIETRSQNQRARSPSSGLLNPHRPKTGPWNRNLLDLRVVDVRRRYHESTTEPKHLGCSEERKSNYQNHLAKHREPPFSLSTNERLWDREYREKKLSTIRLSNLPILLSIEICPNRFHYGLHFFVGKRAIRCLKHQTKSV